MKLTIKCDCGSEYDIDFEPVDGKLPGELICPRCNTDKTDLVNRMVAAQLAASGSTANSQPVATPTPPTPVAEPTPEPRQPLRFKKPGSLLSEPSTPSLPSPASPPPPPVPPPPVPSVASEPAPSTAVKLRRPSDAPTPPTPATVTQPPVSKTPEPTPAASSAGGGGIRLRRPEDAAPRPSAPAVQPAIPAAPTIAGMPVAHEPAASPATTTAQEEEAVPQTCSKHINQPVTMFCFVCKRPMCSLCMKKTGFVCSSYCQGKAKEQNIAIPVFEGQESRGHQTAESGGGRRVGLGLFLILLGLGVAYGWYHYFGSRPALAFSIPAPTSESTDLLRFVDANQFIWAHGNTVEMYDSHTKQPVWSYQVKSASSAADRRAQDNRYWQTKSREIETITDPQERETAMLNLMRRHARTFMDDDDGRTRVVMADHDVLVCSGSTIARLDRHTGTEKTSYPVRGDIDSVSVANGVAFVMSTENYSDKIMTRIQLADGQLQAVTVQAHLDKPTVPGAKPPAGGFKPDDDTMDDNRRDFIPAGLNFAQLDVVLLKKNIVLEDAVRRENQVDLNAVRAGDQGQGISQIMTDITTSRTGGKRKVDKSEYQVAIKRHLNPTKLPPWAGTVIGTPQLFSTDTLDVLIAGQTVHAFSKENKPLWQGTLAYPVESDIAVNSAHPETGPCYERGNTLYIADKGALRAFSISNGAVSWTYPTVGITKIQFDAEGMMYLTTTNADVDSIQYDQEFRFNERIHEVLVKIDVRNMGKELWKFFKKSEKGFTAWATGKHVYVTTSSYSNAEMFAAVTSGKGDVTAHFRIYRLNPKTGVPIWEDYQARSSSYQSLDLSGNQILIAWPDSIELMRYYDLF